MHITTNTPHTHSHYSQVLSQLYLMILPTYLRLYFYDSNNSIMMKYKIHNYILQKNLLKYCCRNTYSPHISLKTLLFLLLLDDFLFIFAISTFTFYYTKVLIVCFSSRQYLVLSCDIFC